MESASPNPPDSGEHAPEPQFRHEQVIVPVVIGMVLLHALWTLLGVAPSPGGSAEGIPVSTVVVP